MVSEISGADGAKTWNFQLLNRCSDQRMLEVWPPQKWGFWCQIRFWGPKNIKGGPKKWKKLFFSKRANLIFYLKSYMASVDLMGTSCTGICLEHQLSIFQLMRRGVCCPIMVKFFQVSTFLSMNHIPQNLRLSNLHGGQSSKQVISLIDIKYLMAYVKVLT